MWRPANLVAAANWPNNFEFSNENNNRTNQCGQQSKQRRPRWLSGGRIRADHVAILKQP
jgi:hypothetical protein